MPHPSFFTLLFLLMLLLFYGSWACCALTRYTDKQHQSWTKPMSVYKMKSTMMFGLIVFDVLASIWKYCVYGPFMISIRWQLHTNHNLLTKRFVSTSQSFRLFHFLTLLTVLISCLCTLSCLAIKCLLPLRLFCHVSYDI